jgi:two-component system sensor kinase FixL
VGDKTSVARRVRRGKYLGNFVHARARQTALWENISPPAHSAFALPRDLQQVYLAAGLTLAYVLMHWLTYHFPGRFGVTPLNPQAALAIALLMFCGMKYLPLVVVAVIAGEYLFVVPARPLLPLLAVSAVLTCGFAAAAAILTRWLRISTALNTRRDVVSLIGITLLCMLLAGMGYVSTLTYFDLDQGGRFFYGSRRFFIGYSVGVLVTAPLIFMVFNSARRARIAAYLCTVECWLQIMAIAACLVWVSFQEQQRHAQNFYLLFLPLVWAATRFGMVGAAVALLTIQAGVFLLFIMTGYKPLSTFELQLLMIALAITGLLLGVTIDEQRRATADFRESLKLAAAGEMAAAIAHEINQPLTALSSYATAGQLIAASPELDRKQLGETMVKLQTETQRAALVVKRLRDFFRSGETRLETVDLAALVARVTGLMQAKAEIAGVSLTHRAAGNLPPALADALQIEVVLRNLISNAIESAAEVSGRQGRVEVTAVTNAAGEVVVSVHDNGAGIRAADKERLFDSFVTTKTSGMGMGLAISRAFMEAHGGRIWAVPGDSGLLCFALPAGDSTGETSKNHAEEKP